MSSFQAVFEEIKVHAEVAMVQKTNLRTKLESFRRYIKDAAIRLEIASEYAHSLRKK
jgi:hypothetical protein